ncbi:ATP-binding protein [Spiractinospora alimapuensis]|uniref:ATP-binding protein n=1 Tax=Spiractinospora alimapuensis TaxID=2820884 RepID=UPI001F1A4D6A|nr:ATP-binding protein [Spiractinospora alimapuensis]QVQ50484.1 ATP-binding protein [Spiractinospora alimapuensis]
MDRWSRMFTARPDQVGAARAFTCGVLEGHPSCDDALVVVSELATNSVQHSLSGCYEGPFIVSIEVHEESVRLSVLDLGSDSEPVLEQPEDATQERGRGLWLVAQLSKEWGVEAVQAEFLRVWAELVPETAP